MSAKEFDEKGFLSSYVFSHRDKVLEDYSSEFSECFRISEEAQRLIVTTGVSGSNLPIVCSFLFAERTLRTCQAAVRLCELGLVQEAQVLVRTALEGLFYSSALLAKPEVYELIQSHEDKEGQKFASSILRAVPADQISPQDMNHLQEMAVRDGGETFSVFQAAEAAGMTELYATRYRFYSAVAGHATFRSLDRSFAKEDCEYAFYMGPTTNQLILTLSAIVECLRSTVINVKIIAGKSLSEHRE